MERIPVWVWILAAMVFVGLGVWSATDENWSGLIVSAVLAIVCLGVWRSQTRKL